MLRGAAGDGRGGGPLCTGVAVTGERVLKVMCAGCAREESPRPRPMPLPSAPARAGSYFYTLYALTQAGAQLTHAASRTVRGYWLGPNVPLRVSRSGEKNFRRLAHAMHTYHPSFMLCERLCIRSVVPSASRVRHPPPHPIAYRSHLPAH